MAAYKSAEITALPVLLVYIPEANSLFRISPRPTKYRVSDLKKTEIGGSTPRTREFERELLRIWQETQDAIPFAFKTADGVVRSLDAGCLGFLASRNPPAIEFELKDGYIDKVFPAAATAARKTLLPTQALAPSAHLHADAAHLPLSHLSGSLRIGHAYSRDDLRELFQIVDATINNGVFKPASASSVMLFVTEHKTSDRTQYHDRLEGNLLYWQGQSSGRTDALIIGHRQRALELLVFFRTQKYEHPNAGFKYLDPFEYVSHSGGHPTDFVLRAQLLAVSTTPVESRDDLWEDPADFEDSRRRTWRAIVQRRGQPAFRSALLQAYGNACAISGCSVLEVLEAAHIAPYTGDDSNNVRNGLLLRADLHTLFDYGLLRINPQNLHVEVAPSLRTTIYGEFHDGLLRPPNEARNAPLAKSLQDHYDRGRSSTG